MPLYLSRFSYTPETWARLIGNPEDRRKAAQAYIESVGGKLQGFWYAFGTHDGYTLWEAPDNVSMAADARDRRQVEADGRLEETEVAGMDAELLSRIELERDHLAVELDERAALAGETLQEEPFAAEDAHAELLLQEDAQLDPLLATHEA